MSNDKIKITIGILTIIALMFGANNSQENNTEKPKEKPNNNNCCELTFAEIQKINAKLEMGIIPEITENNRGYIRDFFNKLINGLYENLPSSLIVAALFKTSPWIFRGIKKISLPFMDYILNNNEPIVMEDFLNDNIDDYAANSNVGDTFKNNIPPNIPINQPIINNIPPNIPINQPIINNIPSDEPPPNNDDKGKDEKHPEIHMNQEEAEKYLMENNRNKVLTIDKYTGGGYTGIYTMEFFEKNIKIPLSNAYNYIFFGRGQSIGYSDVNTLPSNINTLARNVNTLNINYESVNTNRLNNENIPFKDLLIYGDLLADLEIDRKRYMTHHHAALAVYDAYVKQIKTSILKFYTSLREGNFIYSFNALKKEIETIIKKLQERINLRTNNLTKGLISKLYNFVKKYDVFVNNYYDNLHSFISLFANEQNLNIFWINLTKMRNGIFNEEELKIIKKLLEKDNKNVSFEYTYEYFVNLYNNLKREYIKPNENQREILNHLGLLIKKLELYSDDINRINVFLDIMTNNFNIEFENIIVKTKNIIKKCLEIYNKMQNDINGINYNVYRAELNRQLNEIFIIINPSFIDRFLKFLNNKDNYNIIRNLFNMGGQL